MASAATLDTAKDFDCLKCGESFTQGALGNRVKHRRCCTSEERLWMRVVKTPAGCWEHQGCKDSWGYAHVAVDGKRRQAHRYAYELKRGQIPAGKLVLHSCDNPSCINPDHLRLGSDADNHADMRARGRSRYRTRYVLTEDQVRQIKREYHFEKNRSNAKELAARYGVGHGTIVAAVNGRAWRDVK